MNMSKLFGDVKSIASHHGVSEQQAEEMQKGRRDSFFAIVISIVITTLVTLGSNELYNSGILNIPNSLKDTTEDEMRNIVSESDIIGHSITGTSPHLSEQ